MQVGKLILYLLRDDTIKRWLKLQTRRTINPLKIVGMVPHPITYYTSQQLRCEFSIDRSQSCALIWREQVRRLGRKRAFGRMQKDLRKWIDARDEQHFENRSSSLFSEYHVRNMITVYRGQHILPYFVIEEILTDEIYRRFNDDESLIKALKTLKTSMIENQKPHDQQRPNVKK